MLESPLIDELVMEKYGALLTEKTREAAREAASEAAREAASVATRETACRTAHQDIVTILEARFGDVQRDVVQKIESVVDQKQLKGLVRSAASCPDLDAFRNAIARG